MATVYEAFDLRDRSQTGKTISDFTIDFCKDMSGNNVAQDGIAITELGVGKYIFYHPDITARTVVSLYLTADSTVSASIMLDPVDGDVAQQSTLLTIPTSSGGDTAVDHNTGGTNALQAVHNGVGVDNVKITAYLKTDYDAGNTGSSYIQGTTTTIADGTWDDPIYLDAGFTYTIVFYKQGYFETATQEVTI